ncbi:MAG: tRNA glutamyl-Q(34) synthetase GluQRS [Myxococcota bacterium]
MTYVGRFAPSPTGAMHLGHARTALVAWLRTRATKGRIVMRMEDLDPPRVREGSAESILRDHEWLGLDWDEGPVWQSQRFDRYEEVLKTLAPHLFRCSCTRRELQAASAPHGSQPRYPGACYEAPSDPSRPCALRFRMHEPRGFEDALAGDVPGERDDFVVRRSDGLFAYQLAVVVDDHDLGVTEVVRGDDLLGATSFQLALYDALGWTPPAWLHLPLVLGDDGARLAKRHGAISIADYRDAGWSAARLLGLLGRSLGLEVGEETTLPELQDAFSVRDLAREAVRLPGP